MIKILAIIVGIFWREIGPAPSSVSPLEEVDQKIQQIDRSNLRKAPPQNNISQTPNLEKSIHKSHADHFSEKIFAKGAAAFSKTQNCLTVAGLYST